MLAHADTPGDGALDVHGLLDSITDAQRAEYNVAIATWKTATASVPVDHAYILGSLEGEATYNEADSTLITAGLTILPTTYILRIPASWNGRLLFFAPPGFLNHLFFAPLYVEVLKKGYALVIVHAALPGTAGFPYDQFKHGWRTHHVGAAVFSTTHMVKDLLGEAFARPLKTYALTQSGGTLFGSGLLVGRRGNPIDGYVMVTGGNGWRTESDEHMRAYRTENRVPLTGLPTGMALPLTGAAFTRAVDTEIGFADPEYRAFILAGGGYEALVAYDSSTRPTAVQRAWEELTFNPDLQAPVMVIQGTADATQYPRNSLVFTQAVIDAGRNDRLRLYLVKGQPHGPVPPFPQQGVLDALDQMVRWVEEGGPPGDITFDNPASYGIQVVKNHWDAGYPNDPCGYFHHQFDPEIQPPADCGL